MTVTFTAFGVGSAHGTDPGDVAGIGTDNFVSGVNRVRGSNFNDNFTGSNNPANTNELFEGRGGNDFINGGGGFDTAVYGNEDALINVQLAAGTVPAGPIPATTLCGRLKGSPEPISPICSMPPDLQRHRPYRFPMRAVPAPMVGQRVQSF